MRVNAINSVNFQGGNKKINRTDNKPQIQRPESNGYMNKMRGKALLLMFAPAVLFGPTSCNVDLTASADANVDINNPPCPPPCDDDIDFPFDIQDSLNVYVGDYLDIPIDGLDDGITENKVLMNIQGNRDWDYSRLESLTLNPKLSNKYEARYNHNIADSINNDVMITKVLPHELTVVKSDGTVTSNVSGLLFNEDGKKTFVHSNGKDRIHIYPKATSGENEGKYVELGTMEHGYLYNGDGTVNTKYGENIALYNILAEGSEDHFTHIKGKSVDAEEFKNYLKETAEDAEVVE